MKQIYKLLLLSFFLADFVKAQVSDPSQKTIIVSTNRKTELRTLKNGDLEVKVSKKDARRINARGLVKYSDFGAKGDGNSDDLMAIVATHAFANATRLPVNADDDARYYISGKDRTAIIQTDTDFGTASFIIDDTNVENRTSHIFLVRSDAEAYNPEGISLLKKDQDQINIPIPGNYIITVTDTAVRRYIRYGLNQNTGRPQTDIFIVDKEGKVDMGAPIVWDFNQITEIKAIPIDEKSLHIKGGYFTTIANQAESRYTYYSRGLAVRRSNVVIDAIEHRVTGEGDHGAPYNGFINIADCSDVTVSNCLLTGRKTYQTIGAAGLPVMMGSYDITVNRALNVSLINCSQTNDILDRTYWGLMASNYSKNLILDNCTFSRFDAHMGVANATIRNSTLGHQGINTIGSGTFTVENSTMYGRSLINLRSDYGSTWQGEFIIRNCKFIPAGGAPVSASLFGGSYSGQHDFGYTCYMPWRITIENLTIDDSNHPQDYQGPAIFSNFNPEMLDESYEEKYPYVKTREVILRNVSTTSGKNLRISDNPHMFIDVEIKTD